MTPLPAQPPPSGLGGFESLPGRHGTKVAGPRRGDAKETRLSGRAGKLPSEFGIVVLAWRALCFPEHTSLVED